MYYNSEMYTFFLFRTGDGCFTEYRIVAAPAMTATVMTALVIGS